MLPIMVNLIFRILKFCTILTIVRLVSTAFNWEFGISRNYLRLLELLFYLGKKRIEKAESRNKLDSPNSNADAAHANGSQWPSSSSSGGRRETLEFSGEFPKEVDDHGDMINLAATTTALESSESPIRKRRNGIISQISKPSQQQQQKMRRISTPDGPPVFLLDDDDDYEEPANGGSGAICTSSLASGDCCNSGHFVQREFHLLDASKLVVRGLSAIIDDEVTKRFTPEELKTWNLLTRTNAKNYQFMSRSLGLFWLFGVLVRYAILLPLRIMFTLAGFLWLVSSMVLVGLLPRPLRPKPYSLMSQMAFRMLSCGLTSRLKFHNGQYRPQKGDICVANHTSPLDVVLLACDNCYSLVGQRHGGLIGIMETALSRATQHVWFDRAEMRDRQLVSQRLKEHIGAKSNLPVLIFPEGTCINNSAVMLFRKGSFECSDRVCPVAIKYDSRFGDPFWNSSKHGYVQYLLLMMSSWAIKCEVWYLPPMERLPGESSAEFAGRVKTEIARQGGLVDLNWDGQLKRSAPKEQWKFQQQEDYVRRLKFE